MISEHERMELIRQAEKSNLSNQEMDKLQDWAVAVRIQQSMLDLLFEGYIEVQIMNKNDPSFSITQSGQNMLASIAKSDSEMNPEELETDAPQYNDITVLQALAEKIEDEMKKNGEEDDD